MKQCENGSKWRHGGVKISKIMAKSAKMKSITNNGNGWQQHNESGNNGESSETWQYQRKASYQHIMKIIARGMAMAYGSA
jgi:hypothetical protein